MKILMVPLDPVHDVALKMLKRELIGRGYEIVLLPPDMKLEEVVEICKHERPSFIMVSRTVGYGASEILGRFIDLLDASGVRKFARVIVGGKAVTKELAAELGYDAGFGEGTKWEDVVAYIEGRPVKRGDAFFKREKRDITKGYSYRIVDEAFLDPLDEIVSQVLEWVSDKSSPAIERAKIRERILAGEDLLGEYLKLCDDLVKGFYLRGEVPKRVKVLADEEVDRFKRFIGDTLFPEEPSPFSDGNPLIFIQYGTGCPFMDGLHIKICEAWGANGFLHFDPSWGARLEGLLSGILSHEEDGTILTLENLKLIKSLLSESSLWSVRAHRGLNTPETVVLAYAAGADLTKINMVYGSLNGGTDPERLVVDGVYAIKLASKFSLPFDIPTNEELGGIPAYKAFAGMLIVAHLGVKLGAKPILKPLFCFSPDVMINGYMDDNYVDYNVAKVLALREIMDAPIWAGEPIGFMTHSEERVQSALTTALHAGLAKSLSLDAVTIASTDEAYARGAITSASRVDSLRGVKEAFRFLGRALIEPTSKAKSFKELIKEGVLRTLDRVAKRGDFVASLYEGLLGTREEGATPGRAGRGTILRC
ncbi:MAG: cobalamin B12-binding domain-containing protein [Synergistetes bacterium]|uniref:Cobalamin B12-binding domain protein n=1 Tax=Thermotoga petrophila TaxID=93929 RepID=A0A101EPN4_9THEM|nr:MAG: Cobalamin B12-binding domain protein [Thermotoga petrophila]MBC7331240.1 cobalamin B12-binding domain-containing protein [Synergistota bacterium]MDK2871540.1 hypothetical protein [bacterium]